MEPFVILVVLVLVVVIFVLPIAAFVRSGRAVREAEQLRARVAALQAEFARLKIPREEQIAARQTAVERAVSAAAPPTESPGAPLAASLREAREQRPGARTQEPTPTKLPSAPIPEIRPVLPTPPPIYGPSIASPPPLEPVPERQPAFRFANLKGSLNWEQFMGAKLFAWIGGLALFLGVAYFVKYSFEHNLIPPEMRVAIGFVVGLALVVGSLALKRKENVVTSQTLCATGILILYAVTFACRSFYHFAFFGLVPTLLLMALITAVAFLLAVRLNAVAVGILGMAGGFLTPILLSTGQDNPPGLFGYIALLDIGLLMVARRKEWIALPVLGAVGTVLMQIGWVTQFFLRDEYFLADKVLVPMAIFLGFELLFCAALVSTKRGSKSENALSAAALGIGGAAVLWGFYFLSFQAFGNRPALLLSYIFLADIGLLAIVFMKEKLAAVSTVTGLALFVFFAIWTAWYLATQNLYAALAAFFVFALLHSAAPLVLQCTRKIDVRWWGYLFPALALVLVLMPIFNLPEVSFVVWPLVFCVDLLAILLAVATGTLLSILIVLLLTFVVIGGWIFRIPIQLTGLPTSLFLLGGFAIFFMLVAVWACRQLLASAGMATTTRGKLFGVVTDPANFT